MSTPRGTLLTKLLLTTPDNGIVCASHLVNQGISHDNLKKYVKRGYLDSIGRGTYCKHGHNPTLPAAINAVVEQLQTPMHIGGWSALAEHGLLHFLPAMEMPMTLYMPSNKRIPAWFQDAFKTRFVCRRTNLLNTDIAIEERQFNGFSVPVSSQERAILEYLQEVPDQHPLNEAYQIMEMMVNARPELLQSLLEKCSSIKVKRLFLLLAEDLNHGWYEDLKIDCVDIGSGGRVIDKGGTYRSKWLVTVKDWRDI